MTPTDHVLRALEYRPRTFVDLARVLNAEYPMPANWPGGYEAYRWHLRALTRSCLNNLKADGIVTRHGKYYRCK